MSANAFISNGTCYDKAGVAMDPNFLPCGNDALGHKPCCAISDMCLSSNACYNNEFGLTYLAGCSDPEYTDPGCPDKAPFADQPWTGLVYCNGTSDQWVACSQPNDPATLTKPANCFCPETSRTIAFSDSATLSNVVALPKTSGGSVIWQPGFVPSLTTPFLSSTTSTSSNITPATSSTPGGTSNTTGPTQIAPGLTDTGDSGSSSGLSTGAKAGIGVGIGVGAIALFGVLLFFLKHRRRQREEHVAHVEDAFRPSAVSGGGAPTGHGGGVNGGPPAVGPVSELDSRAARPWSMRSELAHDGTPKALAEEMDEADSDAVKRSWTPSSVPGSSAVTTPTTTTTNTFRHSPNPNRGDLSPVAELPG